MVDRLDLQRRISGEPPQPSSSRSNSIQGKKLSLCDPQLTVSHHGKPSISLVVPAEALTYRDSVQRLSINQASSFAAERNEEAKGRRGNHNPRQSKEKLPKKKLKKQPSLNAFLRLQHACRPHVPPARPASSLSRVSLQNQSVSSRERRSLHHSHSQGSINRKQLLSRAKQGPTGFQLTFNNKRCAVQRKPADRPQTALGLKTEARSLSSNQQKLKTIVEARPKSTSPSPQKMSRKSHSAGKSSFSNAQSRRRDKTDSPSDNRTPGDRHSSTSIDHLIRENIKK